MFQPKISSYVQGVLQTTPAAWCLSPPHSTLPLLAILDGKGESTTSNLHHPRRRSMASNLLLFMHETKSFVDQTAFTNLFKSSQWAGTDILFASDYVTIYVCALKPPFAVTKEFMIMTLQSLNSESSCNIEGIDSDNHMLDPCACLSLQASGSGRRPYWCDAYQSRTDPSVPLLLFSFFILL